MLRKLATVATAFILLSTIALGTVSASPNEQTSAGSASFQLLIAALTDANDKGVLSDALNELLADLFIENLIAPITGETVEQARQRLSAEGQSTFQFLVAVFNDANDKGTLSDVLNELLADLFIENLIVPATGETKDQARNRLSAQTTPTATTTPLTTPTSTATPTIAQMVKNVQGGVVQILTITSSGSGFVIDTDGRVVTNQHVVGGNQSVTVRMHDGTEYPASVLGVDAVADLAIVDIAPEIALTPVPLGDSDLVQLGEQVVAIGYPLGYQLGQSMVVTDGIISSKQVYNGVDHLQTNAALNPGNSGGPLFNRAGQVIGVNTWGIRYTPDGTPVEGTSFAVAINELKSRLETLKGSGSPQPVTTPTTVPTPVTPVPTPAAAPTPPPLQASWNRYNNGVYGFSVDTPPGWAVDEDTENFGFAQFFTPDKKASVTVKAYDLPASYSLQALAEWRRNWLTEYARDNSWGVFNITSFAKKQEGGKEFYELAYRFQTTDEFCVSRDVERIYISSWYPYKPHGYRVNTGVCELHLNRYPSATTNAIQNSFTEWLPYWNPTHDFGLNAAPGWILDEETNRENYSAFWTTDRAGVFEIASLPVGSSETLEDFKDWRVGILNEYADTWETFEGGRIYGFGGRIGARDEYIVTYRGRTEAQYCISDRVELIILSSYHPEHEYGFLVITGVCEGVSNYDQLDDERWQMLNGFRN